jgi:hypothetical protein
MAPSQGPDENGDSSSRSIASHVSITSSRAACIRARDGCSVKAGERMTRGPSFFGESVTTTHSIGRSVSQHWINPCTRQVGSGSFSDCHWSSIQMTVVSTSMRDDRKQRQDVTDTRPRRHRRPPGEACDHQALVQTAVVRNSVGQLGYQ